MVRLWLVSVLGVVMLGPCVQAQTLTERIDKLRISDEPFFAGAYLASHGGGGFVWYNVTTGVQAIGLDGRHDRQVREYLERYLKNATRPGGAIDDVENRNQGGDLANPVIVWKVSDSDDAYAATMLSLACWYARRSGGQIWLKANLVQLKHIADANLIDTIDPKTKLSFTYNSQDARFTAPLTTGEYNAKNYATAVANATGYQRIGQMMDNCQVYRGLKDFADRLAVSDDPDAKKYAHAAATIAAGIAGMFDRATKCFRVKTVPAAFAFYPNRLVQVAPQVYGVDLGPHTKEMYDDAWAYMNAGGDEWWKGQIIDQSNQGASAMILGYAAMLRGDRDKAARQLEFFESTLKKMETVALFQDIGELGFALRTQQLMAR